MGPLATVEIGVLMVVATIARVLRSLWKRVLEKKALMYTRSTRSTNRFPRWRIITGCMMRRTINFHRRQRCMRRYVSAFIENDGGWWTSSKWRWRATAATKSLLCWR